MATDWSHANPEGATWGGKGLPIIFILTTFCLMLFLMTLRFTHIFPPSWSPHFQFSPSSNFLSIGHV